MRGEVRQTNGRPWSQTKYQSQADDDKNEDGKNFDKRKPVLELAEAGYLQCIQRDQSDRNPHHPDPLGNRGKPKSEIDSHGRHFRSNRDDLNQSIRSTNRESCPWAEIRLSIDAKGARNGMHNRHFHQRVSDDEGYDRTEKVGHDHTGPSQANCHAASQKEPDTNRPANGQHAELALREPPPQFPGFRRVAQQISCARREALGGLVKLTHAYSNRTERPQSDVFLSWSCSEPQIVEPRRCPGSARTASSGAVCTCGHRVSQSPRPPWTL